MDHALDVLLLDMATIKRVYMDKMDVKSFTSARNEKNILTMQLTWKSKDPQKPELTSKETLKLFSEVTVSLFYDGKEFDFQAVIVNN